MTGQTSVGSGRLGSALGFNIRCDTKRKRKHDTRSRSARDKTTDGWPDMQISKRHTQQEDRVTCCIITDALHHHFALITSIIIIIIIMASSCKRHSVMRTLKSSSSRHICLIRLYLSVLSCLVLSCNGPNFPYSHTS